MDAADFTRGLIVLDHRYANVPSWQFLKKGQLDIAVDLRR
jgi:hypothetical protein